MSTYEELQDQTCADGIDVMDYEFNSPNIKGLYCNSTVAVYRNVINDEQKKFTDKINSHFTTMQHEKEKTP